MNEDTPVLQDLARAYAYTVLALTEAIRELREVPSGHLYARVMGVLSHAQYQRCIETILDSGVVEKRGQVLVWKGAA